MANRLKKKDSPTSLAFLEHDVVHLSAKINSCSTNEKLTEHLRKIVTCTTNGKDQLSFSRDFVDYLKNNIEKLNYDVINILCWFFVCCKNKHPTRRIIKSFVTNLSDEASNTFVEAFSSLLRDVLISDKDAHEMRKIIDMLSSFMENFPKGDIVAVKNCEDILKYLNDVIKEYIGLSRRDESPLFQTQMLHHCLTAFKTLIAVLQKRQQQQHHSSLIHNVSTQETLKCVVNSAISVADDENVLLDCRTAAAMVLPSIILHFPREKVQRLMATIQSEEGCGVPEHEEKTVDGFITRSLCTFVQASSKPSSVIVSLHALLVKIPADVLHHSSTPSHSTVFDTFFIDKLIEISLESTDKNVLVLTFKTIALWVSECSAVIKSNKFDLQSTYIDVLITKVVPHLVVYIDHVIDTIRHSITTALRGCFLTLSITSGDESINRFCEKYFQSDLKSRGKLSVLLSLCEFMNIEKMLSLRAGFPKELLQLLSDVDLAPHACNLYKAVSEKHLKDLEADEVREVQKKWELTWIECLHSELLSCNKEIKANIVNYIIPAMLRVNPVVLKNLLLDISVTHSTLPTFRTVVVFLKSARAIKNTKFEYFSIDTGASSTDETEQCWKGILNLKNLEKCIVHIDEQVRLDVLSLVCNSTRTTDYVDNNDLSLVKLFLKYNMAVENPAFRQQAILCLKKLLVRFFAHAYQLNKSNHVTFHSYSVAYQQFLIWLVDFLFCKLHTSAAYCQISHTLELVCLLKTMFDENKSSVIFCNFSISHTQRLKYTNKLLECFHDTYDPNRILALKMFSGQCLFLADVEEETLTGLFVDALHHICNSQPDVSSVAAYQLCYISLLKEPQCVYSLLADTASTSFGVDIERDIPGELFVLSFLRILLRKQLGVMRKSLVKASQQAPVHGVLFALRLLFQLHTYDLRSPIVESHKTYFAEFLQEFVQYGLEIIELVSPYVSNEAPEGQLCDVSLSEIFQLLDISEVNTTTDVVLQAHIARMILVCCWRSMKEVSLLLGTYVYNFSSSSTKTNNNSCTVTRSSSEEKLLSKVAVVSMWEMFSNILLRSKHAGAYELASVGFLKICTVMWMSDDSQLRDFPSNAVKTLVDDLLSDDVFDHAQVTRRSAGLPFYLQSICSTEPAIKAKESFRYLMKSLTELCKTKLVSHDINKIVISLNILRAFFKDAQLCEDVMPYVSDGVTIALRGFASSLWPIRNSCTLLFSSLMQRIFGVKKFKMTGREFFSRYPSLYEFLLCQVNVDILQNANKEHNRLNPTIYPVLLLLSHLYPSTIEGADTMMRLDKFVPAILRCASSLVYKTRTMAANALVPLIPINKIESTLRLIASEMTHAYDTLNQNMIHGCLLQVKSLIVNTTKIHAQWLKRGDVPRLLQDTMWVLLEERVNFVAKSVYVELLIIMLKNCEPEDIPLSLIKPCIAGAMVIFIDHRPELSRPGFPLCLDNIVQFYMRLVDKKEYQTLLCANISQLTAKESCVDTPLSIFRFLLKPRRTELVLELLPSCTSNLNIEADLIQDIYEMVMDCSTAAHKFSNLLSSLMCLSRKITGHFQVSQIVAICRKCLKVKQMKDEMKLATLEVFNVFMNEFVVDCHDDGLRTKENLILSEIWGFIESCSAAENCEVVRMKVAALLLIPINQCFFKNDIHVYSYYQCAINLLNDAECEVRDEAAQNIASLWCTRHRQSTADRFCVSQSCVIFEELFVVDLYEKMEEDPHQCVIFLLCVACQVPFYDVLEYSLTREQALHNGDSNDIGNLDVYKRFVVFEKGKDNPYWNEKFIFESVLNVFKRFTIEHSPILQSMELQSELRKYTDNLRVILQRRTNHFDVMELFSTCCSIFLK